VRTNRSNNLGSRNRRKELDPGRDYMETLATGQYLSYRRPLNGGAGTWTARVYNPETGKIVRQGLGSADDLVPSDGIKLLTFEQAKVRADDWFKEVAQKVSQEMTGEVAQTAPYTVAAAWADYLADAKRRGVKGTTIYETVAKAQILPALGEVEVDQLTKKHIEAWHLGVAETPRHTGKKIKEPAPGESPEPPKVLTQDETRARRDTANRVLTILKACLNYALDSSKRVHGSAPWRIVKPFRDTTASRVRVLTPDEQAKLISACDDEFRPLVMAGLYTGARYGELSRVEVKDFNGTTLLIKWGKSKGAYKARNCFLTAEAKEWFAQLVKGREESELMFKRKDALRTTRDELKDFDGWASYDQIHAMAKACKSAGIPSVGFHQLRHTAATKLLASGVAGVYVSKQLGHSDGRMIARHYGHLTDADMEKAISGVK